MELHDRIKILRRSQRLSQAAFGRRIGVSRSVIDNLERGILLNANSIVPLVKLISKEFSVSENWLWRGETTEPEYIPVPGADLYTSFVRRGADEFELELLRLYSELDEVQRKIYLQTYRQNLHVADSIVSQ